MGDLAARAADLGIETEYVDARGTKRVAAPDVLERLVSKFGGAEAQCRTLVWRRGVTHDLNIDSTLGAARWRLFSGEEEIARGALRAGRLVIGEQIPLGVYRLVFAQSRKEALTRLTTHVIVAPQAAYQLQDIDRERIWVLAVQLYALRSGRNWGHGDFTDLNGLMQLAAAAGAAGIGLNPLHALFDDRAQQASPYSPNSRLFLNPLYIDVEAIPEFPGLAESGLADEVERVRTSERIDYAAVAAAKEIGLRLAYHHFQERPDLDRHAQFNAFRRQHWPHIGRFAAFEVLRRKFQRVWWEWPDEWRRPTDDRLHALREEAADEIGYYEFVQWIADRQLAQVRDEADRLGLPIGLYIDVAVGVEPGGADAWSQQDSMIPQIEVGAPPDLLNTAGQAWGLAAFNPRGLEAQAFAPFAELVLSAMRHAGAVRLDHVLGLNRLFLIPFGCSAQDGTYVRYPFQALLAVVALLSEKQRCLVIGEDLGTVPPELRDILADWGVWSYLVMLFERTQDGSFMPPQAYRRNALVTFSTHDLPSFAGWRDSHDLRVKHEVGIDPGETDAERRGAHWLLGEALSRSGVCVDRGWEFADVVRFLARTPSRLMVVALDDVLGVRDQPNVPGTMDEHPNWRRRLPVPLEDMSTHEGLRAVAAVLTEEGRDFRG